MGARASVATTSAPLPVFVHPSALSDDHLAFTFCNLPSTGIMGLDNIERPKDWQINSRFNEKRYQATIVSVRMSCCSNILVADESLKTAMKGFLSDFRCLAILPWSLKRSEADAHTVRRIQMVSEGVQAAKRDLIRQLWRNGQLEQMYEVPFTSWLPRKGTAAYDAMVDWTQPAEAFAQKRVLMSKNCCCYPRCGRDAYFCPYGDAMPITEFVGVIILAYLGIAELTLPVLPSHHLRALPMPLLEHISA
jgi:hypothetical protein